MLWEPFPARAAETNVLELLPLVIGFEWRTPLGTTVLAVVAAATAAGLPASCHGWWPPGDLRSWSAPPAAAAATTAAAAAAAPALAGGDRDR